MNTTPINQPYIYAGVYGISHDPVNIADKPEGMKFYISHALCRVMSMFKYKNLPDTIPKRSLELYIMTGGSACIAKHGEDLYAFFGTFGGEPDAYYMPKSYVVANPYLNFSKEFEIDKDCVVIPNDSMYMGLMPLFKRYSTLLVENDITMNIADINMRIAALLTADSDRDRASAEEYIKNVFDGKLGVAASSAFLEGIKAQPYATHDNSTITQLIELQQYYKASMLNDIGLNANYNMKREAIVAAEIEMNADALFPFIDDMMYCRKKAIKKVNDMFGTEIEIDFNSAWKDLYDDREIRNIQMEAETLNMIGGQPQEFSQLNKEEEFSQLNNENGESQDENTDEYQNDTDNADAENPEVNNGEDDAQHEEYDVSDTLEGNSGLDADSEASTTIQDALEQQLEEIVTVDDTEPEDDNVGDSTEENEEFSQLNTEEDQDESGDEEEKTDTE